MRLAGEIRQGREAANERCVVMHVTTGRKGSWILPEHSGNQCGTHILKPSHLRTRKLLLSNDF